MDQNTYLLFLDYIRCRALTKAIIEISEEHVPHTRSPLGVLLYIQR